jgi:hypothetical protein
MTEPEKSFKTYQTTLPLDWAAEFDAHVQEEVLKPSEYIRSLIIADLKQAKLNFKS